MMTIPILSEEQVFDQLIARNNASTEEYYAFYSSWFGGIVKNPRLMLIPIDDHMVHRGDGVFEAMKAVSRSIYLLDEHLNRLMLSAEKISLKIPLSFDEMKALIIETLKVANQSDALIRIFISRGPGNFSVNPYDTLGSQVYVAITQLSTPSAEKYEKGVRIGKSNIPVKPSWLAQVKSCNYLPNVLMKKEALDRSLDYAIGIDENGYLTESATENMMIVDENGVLIHPPLDSILKGTTMIRACELAREDGMKTQRRLISIEDLQSAQEVLITGTSLNILPVVDFEGHKIGDGRPAVVAKKLRALLLKDIETGPRRTPF